MASESTPKPKAKPKLAVWSLYLLRTHTGALYTGISTDVERRFEEHCSGGPKAAKSLRAAHSLELVYQVRVGSRSLAQSAEWACKQLKKPAKEKLVSSQPKRKRFLGLLGLEASSA